MRRLKGTKYIGVLVTPNAHNAPAKLLAMGFEWMAMDNGAFKNFVEREYLRLLGLCVGYPLMWVTAPDKVGDAAATLALFEIWEPRLRAMGFKVALVAQDGLTIDRVPWDRIDCLFIGGTDDWKLSPGAVALCGEAKRRGKLVHVGRCNSFVRIRAAMAMGADSVDGSQFSWWPDRYIPKGLKWIRRAIGQLAHGSMFGHCPLEHALVAGRRKYRPGPLGPKRRPRPMDAPLFEEPN